MTLTDQELAAAIERTSEEIAQMEQINDGTSTGCVVLTDDSR